MKAYEFRGRGRSGVDEETEALAERAIGAAMEVHSALGPGLPESADRKSLSRELTLRGIPHACEVPVIIDYKGERVGEGRIDILVAGRLILELKAVDRLTDVHRAQCITYLAVTKLKLALLINFNVAVLRDGIKRAIRSY